MRDTDDFKIFTDLRLAVWACRRYTRNGAD
jgi:hypothetical protein